MTTLRDAQKKLREHGMVLKKTGYGNEHRVNFHKGREETASYHDDVEDAIGTGMEMSKNAMKEHEHPYWNNKK